MVHNTVTSLGAAPECVEISMLSKGTLVAWEGRYGVVASYEGSNIVVMIDNGGWLRSTVAVRPLAAGTSLLVKAGE